MICEEGRHREAELAPGNCCLDPGRAQRLDRVRDHRDAVADRDADRPMDAPWGPHIRLLYADADTNAHRDLCNEPPAGWVLAHVACV
jgi:hypothetical protein